MKKQRFFLKVERSSKMLLLLSCITGMLASAPGVPAASLSELMEQGIYSEETKGDLDGALQIYQKVVSEAKDGRELAAQAQYRVGVCYYKKKNFSEAAAAFEKLIKDFPDQKKFVAMASDYLASSTPLLPAPWVDGEEMQLDIKFPTGFKLGTAIYGVSAGELGGRKIWRVSSRLSAGPQSLSRVEVDADSFKPIQSRWKHTLIGDVEATYLPGRAELKTVGKDEIKKVDLEGVVYDNEEVIQLLRRLPLAAGYSANLRIVSSLGGAAIIPIKAEVVGQEKVQTPAGTFDCYKIELSVKQTFWYSADAHRYLVKFEANGIVAELASIHLAKAGAPVKYQDPAGRFSLIAPPDWAFSAQELPGEAAGACVVIFDTEAVTTGKMNVKNLEKITAAAKASPRAWAQAELAETAKVVKGFQIRSDSWKERALGGQNGISVISDYSDGQESKVVYSVFGFSKTKAAEFFFFVGAKDFERLRPQMDTIVDSFKFD